MANLRTAMDAAFWDLDISSPQTLHGAARTVPGESLPLEGARASRVLRVQQLSLLGDGFPLGIIPSFSHTSRKDMSSFSFQSLFFGPSTSNWLLGLVGQFRPKKLISSIKPDQSVAKESGLSAFKQIAKRFVDKSLFSFGLCSQLSLTPSSSLTVSTERHGDKKGCRNRVMLFHQLPFHDITLDAAWPELFIDHKGTYWEVPESISLDLSSLVSESGFRYRIGIHKNGGHPQSVNAINDEVPSALMPGLCAKAAFSYEKSRDFWRKREKMKDCLVKIDQGLLWQTPYDMRLSEAHAAISGIIGGYCEAWYGGLRGHDDGSSADAKRRNPFSVDLFASACCTFQHGHFRKLYGDLTRVDARLNICSASALAKRVSNQSSSSANGAKNPLSSPRLNLVFQQQVVGPIVFRVDSKFLLESAGGTGGCQLEDYIYSLNYSLRALESGKVVAWYSPKKKEGMVELRLYEF